MVLVPSGINYLPIHDDAERAQLPGRTRKTTRIMSIMKNNVCLTKISFQLVTSIYA